MNTKFLKFLKGFMQALSANVVRLLISIILTLLFPKLLGEMEYSLWQLYLFYVTYTAYSSLGFCEGTYLKYGGMGYDEIDKKKVANQFWSLACYEVIFSILCGIFFSFIVREELKLTILCLALVSSIFDILRYQLQTVLQATNRIKEFAGIMTAERILFFAFAMTVLLLGYDNFLFLVFSEILSRFISMVYAMFVCRDCVFCSFSINKESLKESRELISIGFKLLVATLASQLVIGIVRFAIEQKWGVLAFGKVSLTLSLSNMIITCIGAVSIVLFPVLKRMDQEKLERLYMTMRTLLTVVVLAALLIYAPMKFVLSNYLPQYAESLKYLGILMPICVYETRSFALINTYFKAYRKENYILVINLITVGCSIVMSGITVYLLGNMDLAVISIVLLMMLKSILSEYAINKIISIHVLKENILEMIVILVFIVTSFKLSMLWGTFVYAFVYGVYLIVCRKSVKEEIMQAKLIMRK